MISTKGIGIFERVEIAAVNLTGVALLVGGVYALDITRANGASIDPDSSVTNVVAASAANIRCLLVVAMQATAIGATGRFLLKGYGPVLVDGTSAVVAGDRLIPQAALVALIKQPNPSLVNPAGMALAAQAIALAGGTLTQIYFNGEIWKGERAAS